MDIKKAAGYFIMVAVITMVANAATVYFYNLIVYGAGKFTWGSSVVMSVLFAVIMTVIFVKYKKPEK